MADFPNFWLFQRRIKDKKKKKKETGSEPSCKISNNSVLQLKFSLIKSTYYIFTT